jgi:predicted dehydrogenase
MNFYKCVVIGCGKVGMEYGADNNRFSPRSHIEAAYQNPKVNLVAVCDTNILKAEEVKRYIPDIKVYSDAEECITNEKPDIVIIAASTNAHKNLVELACNAGAKMIVCEKPLCKNSVEAKQLTKKIIDAGVIFVLNYQRRFFPLFHSVRRELSQGRIGRTQQVTCYYSNGLYNNAGHLLDAIMFLLEEHVVCVSGTFNEINSISPENDKNIDGILTLESGARVVFQSFNQSAYGIHELKIYGTTGSVAIKEHGYLAEWKKVKVTAGIPTFEMEEVVRKEESFVKGALDEAIKCYEKGTKPLSGLKNGTDVLIVLDSLVQSAINNGISVAVPYMK